MPLVPLAAALSLVTGAPGYTPAARGGEARLEYVYDLTTTTAKVTLQWPRLSWDPDARELLLIDGRGVRIFNAAGVEVYRFRNASTLVQITDAIAMPGGDILLVGVRDRKRALVRCDFRGRSLGDVEPKGLPPALADFPWAGMVRAGDRLHLFDRARLRVVSLGLDLAFAGVVDFGKAMAAGADPGADLEPGGFWVGAGGTIYVGFPYLFRVAVIAPDGTVRGFGEKGSAPGRFNVISGVAADEDGYVYVSDVLKSAVEVFDPRFRFVGQVAGLVGPGQLLYADGKLYVTQGGSAGVAVFRVHRQPPAAGGAGRAGADPAASGAAPAASRGRRRPRRRRTGSPR